MVDRSAAVKFDILRQIFELARRQRTALEEDALELFQRMLDERDDLIGRLQALAAGSAELPENVIAFPGVADAAVEDELALDTVLRGILEHDRHNEALLASKMEEIHRQLPELAAARHAVSGYRLDGARDSFIDRLS